METVVLWLQAAYYICGIVTTACTLINGIKQKSNRPSQG